MLKKPRRSRWTSPLGYLLLSLFFTGCGSGTSVILLIFLNTTSQSDTTGDGTIDWDDEFQTPTDHAAAPLAIAILSAKLFGPDSESYTIFERDNNDPLIIRPITGSPSDENRTEIFTNGDDLPNGTYDRLVLEIVFYEAAIRVYDADSSDFEVRRLRVYLRSFTENLPDTPRDVLQYDQLMSDDPFTPPAAGNSLSADVVGGNGKNLQWIHRENGVLCAETIRDQCLNSGTGEVDVYQSEVGQFSGSSVSMSIDSDEIITVDSDTDKTFTITLDLGIEDLFFYDDDDASTTEFHYLDDTVKDGQIEAACNPSNCSAVDEADFWLGPPDYLLTVDNS